MVCVGTVVYQVACIASTCIFNHQRTPGTRLSIESQRIDENDDQTHQSPRSTLVVCNVRYSFLAFGKYSSTLSNASRSFLRYGSKRATASISVGGKLMNASSKLMASKSHSLKMKTDQLAQLSENAAPENGIYLRRMNDYHIRNYIRVSQSLHDLFQSRQITSRLDLI